MFGRKQRRINELEKVAAGLQSMMARLGGERGEVARERAALQHIRRQIEDARDELAPLEAALSVRRAGVVQYHHPLESSADYRIHLEMAQAEMKLLIASGEATSGVGDCTFNGSAEQGAAMVADWRQMMLRTYNIEAENCLLMVRASSAGAARKRLEQAAEDIDRLSQRFGVRISARYRALRTYELELTIEHLRKKLEAKRRTRKAA